MSEIKHNSKLKLPSGRILTVLIRAPRKFRERLKLTRRERIAWTKALESGKFKQGIGCLLDKGKYCCLGVYAKINNFKNLGRRAVLEDEWCPALQQSGDFQGFILKDGDGSYSALSSLNDTAQLSFKDIAFVIRKFWS